MPIPAAIIRARGDEAQRVEVPGVNPGAFYLILPLTDAIRLEVWRKHGVCRACRGLGYYVTRTSLEASVLDLVRHACPLCGHLPAEKRISHRDQPVLRDLLERVIRGCEGVNMYNPDGTVAGAVTFSPQHLEDLSRCPDEAMAVLDAAERLTIAVFQAEGKASEPQPKPTSAGGQAGTGS